MSNETSDTPEPIDLDFAGQINIEATCSGCGYSLRGLKQNGRRPECSYPIIDSLRPVTPHRNRGQKAFMIMCGVVVLGILFADLGLSVFMPSEYGLDTTILFGIIWAFVVFWGIIALIAVELHARATAALWVVLILGVLLAILATTIHVITIPILMPVMIVLRG